MKKKISIFAFAATTLLAMSAVACGGGGGGGGSKWNVDGPNKVKIVTANFGGGIGNEWLANAAERFAEKMATHTFASGKVGVYIDTSFSDFNLGTGAGMETSARSIYFDERFSDVQKLANAGYLLNLDEIVKDSTRTGGTLDSNLFSTIKDGLQVDGSYYGLPHYEYYGGMSYNREVFDELGAYFVDPSCSLYAACNYDGKTISGLSGNIAGTFYDDPDMKLAVGPDGKANTIDDGLPRTLEEFCLLMDYIKYRNYSPVALSGQYNRYMDYLVSGLWASFAGADQMRNYYNCSGEIEVIKRDVNGNILYDGDKNLITGINYIKKPQTEKITMAADGSDGYRGNDMAAKYYALAVLDVIYNCGFLTKNASSGTNTHYDAQGDLFLGRYSQGSEKAAMLIEGTYWYNETEEFAKNLTKFERLSSRKANTLDIRWMNLPTSVNDDDFVGKEQCLLDIGHSYTMINKNVENNADLKYAVVEFCKFLYSEQELANFTLDTGMSRMVKYEVPADKMDSFEPFYRKLYEQRQKNTDNVIGLSGTTKCFALNKDALKIELQSQCLKEAAGTPRTLYGILSGGKTHAAEIHNMYLKTTKANWKTPNN